MPWDWTVGWSLIRLGGLTAKRGEMGMSSDKTGRDTGWSRDRLMYLFFKHKPVFHKGKAPLFDHGKSCSPASWYCPLNAYFVLPPRHCIGLPPSITPACVNFSSGLSSSPTLVELLTFSTLQVLFSRLFSTCVWTVLSTLTPHGNMAFFCYSLVTHVCWFVYHTSLQKYMQCLPSESIEKVVEC